MVETAAEEADRVDSQHSIVINDSGSVSEEEHLPTKVTIKADMHPRQAKDVEGDIVADPTGDNTRKPSTSRSHDARTKGKHVARSSQGNSAKRDIHAARSSQGISANHDILPTIDQREERLDATGDTLRRRRKDNDKEKAKHTRATASHRNVISKPKASDKQSNKPKDIKQAVGPSVEGIPTLLPEQKCKQWQRTHSQKRQYVDPRKKHNNLNTQNSEIVADSDYQDYESEESQSDNESPSPPSSVMKHRGYDQPLRNKPREREHVDMNNEDVNDPRLPNQLWDKDYTIPRVKRPHTAVENDDEEEDSEYVPESGLDSFNKKIHLVHLILGDKIPEVNNEKKRTKTRTMYQTEIVPEELKSSFPISSVVRSAMDRAHDNMLEQLPKNAINNKCDGFPLKERTMSSNKKFYAPRSVDFHLEQATIDPQLAPRIKQNNVSIDSKVIRSLDEGYRLSLAAQSTQEYFLAAIHKLVMSIDDMNNSNHPENAKSSYYTAAVQKCVSLMESVGRSQTDVADCSALGLTQLQVIRRDMLLKQLNIASPELVEELRSQPVVWSDDVEVKDDQHRLIFRGKTDQIDEYQKKEADRRCANIFLQRQGYNDNRKDWKDKKRTSSSQPYDRERKRPKWVSPKKQNTYWENRKPGFVDYKENKGYKGRGGEQGRGRGRGRGKFSKSNSTSFGAAKKSI